MTETKTRKLKSRIEVENAVADLRGEWDNGKATALAVWCDDAGLRGAASMLRTGTDVDRPSILAVRSRVVEALHRTLLGDVRAKGATPGVTATPLATDGILIGRAEADEIVTKAREIRERLDRLKSQRNAVYCKGLPATPDDDVQVDGIRKYAKDDAARALETRRKIEALRKAAYGDGAAAYGVDPDGVTSYDIRSAYPYVMRGDQRVAEVLARKKDLLDAGCPVNPTSTHRVLRGAVTSEQFAICPGETLAIVIPIRSAFRVSGLRLDVPDADLWIESIRFGRYEVPGAPLHTGDLAGLARDPFFVEMLAKDTIVDRYPEEEGAVTVRCARCGHSGAALEKLMRKPLEPPHTADCIYTRFGRDRLDLFAGMETLLTGMEIRTLLRNESRHLQSIRLRFEGMMVSL